ncbi:hypothetical protein BU26DRAFT_571579 [Trematosphaeria pertusa]|uniref:ABM domain-containing protein n=1 Tax=Trematosphaeria pertusa TaxID=390896 RepID=A0A6A6HUI5_9PLEO|nr:uncharacterized protein BU26DRAFT_571579 [Trematosphaeria pertusa]KAF2241834.1 hypothetical protein BU26DRAFT_571579 [Trematosphaeria pertusa]
MERALCEWITIIVPWSMHEPGKELGQAWLALLRELWAQKTLPGFRGHHWAREQQDCDKLSIWTFWEHKDAYDAQKDTENARFLYSKLAALSTTPVQYYWPCITLLNFSEPISKEKRNTLQTLRCLTSSSPIDYPPGMGPPPAQGFVLPLTSSTPSSSPTTYVILHLWDNPARGKMVRARTPWFAASLMALGPVCTRTERPRFKSLVWDPSTGPNYAIQAPSFEFDMARGLRAEKRRGKTLHGKRKRRLPGRDNRITRQKWFDDLLFL